MVKTMKDTMDQTWALCEINIWSFIESGCGLIGTCLPTLKPLVPRFANPLSSAATKHPKRSISDFSSSHWSSTGEENKIKIQPTHGFSRLHEREPQDLLLHNMETKGYSIDKRAVITTSIEISNDEESGKSQVLKEF